MQEINLSDLNVSNVKKPGLKENIICGVLSAAAAVMFALALNLFLVGNKIAAGGISGLATALNYLIGTPIGLVIICVNLPLFAFTWKNMGTRFAFFSLSTAIILSISVDLMSFLPTFTHERLLAALYGGVFNGIGMGMLLYAGAASGGTDLIARLIRRAFPGLSMGRIMSVLDGAIVVFAGVAYRDVETVLYSAIAIFVCSHLTDTILNGFDYAKVAYIITDRPHEIAEAIFSSVNQGVTSLDGVGMYTSERRSVLMTVIKRHQTLRLKMTVKATDPKAFVILAEAVEVLGRGFKED